MAIAPAKGRIRSNPNCQKFFRSEGEQALKNTRFTLQYLPIPRIAAQVQGEVVLLNRTPSGVFMTPPRDFMGLTDPTEIRAFYILHELAPVGAVHRICKRSRRFGKYQRTTHAAKQ
jgi:hypothetical protein